MDAFRSVLVALNKNGVRYVVVGGLAVVLHGHPRLTAELNLVVDPGPEKARRAVETLVSLGFHPRAPVDPLDFADTAKRAGWASDNHMTVFSMYHPEDQPTEVDLFVESPIDFEELWSRSQAAKLGDTEVRVASLQDLIAVKRRSGRPQDLADIEVLEEIEKEQRT